MMTNKDCSFPAKMVRSQTTNQGKQHGCPHSDAHKHFLRVVRHVEDRLK